MSNNDPMSRLQERARQQMGVHRHRSDLANWAGLVATSRDPVEAFEHASQPPVTRDPHVKAHCAGLRRAAEQAIEIALGRHVDAIPVDHPRMDDLLRLT